MKKIFEDKTKHLQDGETEGTTRDTDDVVVDSNDNELEGVFGSNGDLAGSKTLASQIQRVVVQGNVGKLAVVGRAHGVDIVHVKRVRVHVVTSGSWD